MAGPAVAGAVVAAATDLAAGAVVAVGVVIFTGSALASASACLAISEGNCGAPAATVVAVAADLSAVFHHDIFGADLQPKEPQLIAKPRPIVITLTRMASVPSIKVYVSSKTPSWRLAVVRASRSSYSCQELPSTRVL